MASRDSAAGLRLSEPDDAFEREANRVADEVMKPTGRRPRWSISSMSIGTPLSRKCACGESGECEECRQKTLARKAGERGYLTPSNFAVPSIVADVLGTPGQPLDTSTRAILEPRFGHDFRKVRIHADSEAAAAARAVGARGYTVGRDIVFGAGQFAPRTEGGRKLLAHELAHVIQPTSGGSVGISQPGDAGEREAERAANAYAKGEPVRAGAAHGAALQRQVLQGSQAPRAGDQLIEQASPFLGAALGSTTLDGFDTGKSDLKPDHREKLASAAHSIVTLLRKYSMSTVLVTGYTDTVGTEERNAQLGLERAEAVKQALTSLGVPEAIITTFSKGEGPPQAVKTKDEVPNARNRRVQVRFDPQANNLGPITPRFQTPSPRARPSDQYDQPEKAIDPNYHAPLSPETSAPASPFRKLPAAEVIYINNLLELYKRTTEAVAKDSIVRGLREGLSRLQPFLPQADAKKLIDKALTALVKFGLDSGIQALLQAAAGRSPSPMPENREQIGPTAPLPFPSPSIKSPQIPIGTPPSPHPSAFFRYKGGPLKSYAPGAAIKFTVVPPANFLNLTGVKRVVIVAEADRSDARAERLGQVELESASPRKVELKAPQKPGKYVIRIDVGGVPDYSSPEEFEVTAAEKK